jgi:hypothetical protein
MLLLAISSPPGLPCLPMRQVYFGSHATPSGHPRLTRQAARTHAVLQASFGDAGHRPHGIEHAACRRRPGECGGRSPSMRSDTYWKERVCWPSPKMVSGCPVSACATKLDTTRPSSSAMLGPYVLKMRTTRTCGVSRKVRVIYVGHFHTLILLVPHDLIMLCALQQCLDDCHRPKKQQERPRNDPAPHRPLRNLVRNPMGWS